MLISPPKAFHVLPYAYAVKPGDDAWLAQVDGSCNASSATVASPPRQPPRAGRDRRALIMATGGARQGQDQHPTVMRLHTTVLAGGVLLAMAVLAAAAALGIYARQERLQAELQRSELLARVLEDHATRSFESASLALAALATS
jgi:hypothetical protein